MFLPPHWSLASSFQLPPRFHPCCFTTLVFPQYLAAKTYRYNRLIKGSILARRCVLVGTGFLISASFVHSKMTETTPSSLVAIVTGANKGIGFAIIRKLADPNLGLTTILTSRDEQRGKEAVASLTAEGLDVLYHPLDITKQDSIDSLASWVKERFGGLDILVNNAGMAYRGDAFGYDVAKNTVDCNYFGTLHVTQTLSPLFREGARIVNVSSRAGKFSRLSPSLREQFFRPDLTLDELSTLMNSFVESVKDGTYEQKGWPKQTYGVSKMGVTIMTRILARDETRPNILYNACCPGYVRTDMTNPNAPLSPEQGAITPVYLALLPEGGLSGGFFAEKRQWDITKEL
eukprot:jgi/Galph1/4680/GphlegSOOS_G3357.1